MSQIYLIPMNKKLKDTTVK